MSTETGPLVEQLEAAVWAMCPDNPRESLVIYLPAHVPMVQLLGLDSKWYPLRRTVTMIPGGKAEQLGWPPERYDQQQLALGIEVELEHTNDRRVAREIAMDHLAEQVLAGLPQDYYTRLRKMEGEMEANASHYVSTLTVKPAAADTHYDDMGRGALAARVIRKKGDADGFLVFERSGDAVAYIGEEPGGYGLARVKGPVRERGRVVAWQVSSSAMTVETFPSVEAALEWFGDPMRQNPYFGYEEEPGTGGLWPRYTFRLKDGRHVAVDASSEDEARMIVGRQFNEAAQLTNIQYPEGPGGGYLDNRTQKPNPIHTGTWQHPDGRYASTIRFGGLDPETEATIHAPSGDVLQTRYFKYDFDAEEWLERQGFQQAFAQNRKWSTDYINRLPDSSFAYIQPGGRRDADGKTTPRSLRHLPYKNHLGNVDPAHAANALARLNQVESLPAQKVPEVRAKLERAYAGSGGYRRNESLDYERAMEIANEELAEGNNSIAIWKRLRKEGFDDHFAQAIAVLADEQRRQRVSQIERGPTLKSSGGSWRRAEQLDPFYRNAAERIEVDDTWELIVDRSDTNSLMVVTILKDGAEVADVRRDSWNEWHASYPRETVPDNVMRSIATATGTSRSTDALYYRQYGGLHQEWPRFGVDEAERMLRDGVDPEEVVRELTPSMGEERALATMEAAAQRVAGSR